MALSSTGETTNNPLRAKLWSDWESTLLEVDLDFPIVRSRRNDRNSRVASFELSYNRDWLGRTHNFDSGLETKEGHVHREHTELEHVAMLTSSLHSVEGEDWAVEQLPWSNREVYWRRWELTDADRRHRKWGKIPRIHLHRYRIASSSRPGVMWQRDVHPLSAHRRILSPRVSSPIELFSPKLVRRIRWSDRRWHVEQQDSQQQQWRSVRRSSFVPWKHFLGERETANNRRECRQRLLWVWWRRG